MMVLPFVVEEILTKCYLKMLLLSGFTKILNYQKILEQMKKYSSLLRMSIWATEKAKIELSAQESVIIRLDESEVRCEDENGKEIYLDVPVYRDKYNTLINPKIDETIEKARAVIKKCRIKTRRY